jgi:hypothetical protein
MKQLNKNMEFSQILIRRYMIIGERRIMNYWWAFIISVGSIGFLLTGISSYLSSFSISDELGSNLLSESLNNSFLPNDLSAGVGGNPFILSELFSSSIFNELKSHIFSTTTIQIPFFPQGLLMFFYGSLGILLSLYWWFLIFWNVGAGFNEFNKKDGFIRVFRWGYPGKNRKIDLSYSLKDVEAIKVELKQGLDPQRTIFLKLKGNREIPLTGIGQPLTLKDIEKQASELANFLQVSLEGL